MGQGDNLSLHQTWFGGLVEAGFSWDVVGRFVTMWAIDVGVGREEGKTEPPAVLSLPGPINLKTGIAHPRFLVREERGVERRKRQGKRVQTQTAIFRWWCVDFVHSSTLPTDYNVVSSASTE